MTGMVPKSSFNNSHLTRVVVKSTFLVLNLENYGSNNLKTIKRTKELNYKILKDISYVAAMGKAGGGRNATDPRFLSLFSVFNMCFPSDESG